MFGRSALAYLLYHTTEKMSPYSLHLQGNPPEKPTRESILPLYPQENQTKKRLAFYQILWYNECSIKKEGCYG